MLNPTKVGGNVKMLGVNVKMLSEQCNTWLYYYQVWVTITYAFPLLHIVCFNITCSNRRLLHIMLSSRGNQLLVSTSLLLFLITFTMSLKCKRHPWLSGQQKTGNDNHSHWNVVVVKYKTTCYPGDRGSNSCIDWNGFHEV